jgi:hypothetical protein
VQEYYLQEGKLIRCVFIILASLTAILSCAPLETDIPVNVIQTATVIPSILANTITSVPTETPTASASITPLPTIPTFTPTFDARTIVTVTPAPPAACPKEDPEIVTDFSGPYIYGSGEILTYLNSGGALAQLATSLSGPKLDSSWGKIIDLTGDGLTEIVYRGLVRYDILGCKDGKYQNLFEFATNDFSVDLKDVLDLNKDGIPELIFYSFSRYGFAEVYIVGWDGNSFRSLIDVGIDTTTDAVLDSVSATAYHKLMDTNGDGLKEIVVMYNVKELCGGLGGLCDGDPTRKQTTTLGWNGQNYVDLRQGNYAPPQYRFQAIQDGDWQTRYGNYAGALSFYQAAIFDDRLEWWSPERREYDIYTYSSQSDPKPTVYPTPILDNTEYPRLAAYAYYRIMLLHLVQRHESDAGTVYKTLQQKFGNDQYGQPYVEMATAFWEAYQSTHKMYDGCAAAIQYAAEHPEILIPLGSDYHGAQSHIYVPADVCPFR